MNLGFKQYEQLWRDWLSRVQKRVRMVRDGRMSASDHARANAKDRDLIWGAHEAYERRRQQE